MRGSLAAAFDEDRPPREVASSFSAGLFLAALPNFGLALVVFAALAYLHERVSKLALVAAVVVMNPVVKWGVYVVAFWLGSQVLGPVPADAGSLLSLSAGRPVIVRLLLGNVLIAGVVSAGGYVAALRFARALEHRDLDVGELVQAVSFDDPE